MRYFLVILCSLMLTMSSCVTLLYNGTSVQDEYTIEKYDQKSLVKHELFLEASKTHLIVSVKANEVKLRYEQKVKEVKSRSARTFSDVVGEIPDDMMFIGWIFLAPAAVLDIVNPFPILGFETSHSERKSDWKAKERVVGHEKLGVAGQRIQLSTHSSIIHLERSVLRTLGNGTVATKYHIEPGWVSKDDSRYHLEEYKDAEIRYVNIEAETESLQANIRMGPFKCIRKMNEITYTY